MKTNARPKQLNAFRIGLPLILMFIAWRHAHKASFDAQSMALVAAALVSVVMALVFPKIFEAFFNVWMKVTGIIGKIVTTSILGLIFFIVFTPVALILRIIQKDFMQRSWKGQLSYWNKCKPVSNRDEYLNQF